MKKIFKGFCRNCKFGIKSYTNVKCLFLNQIRPLIAKCNLTKLKKGE